VRPTERWLLVPAAVLCALAAVREVGVWAGALRSQDAEAWKRSGLALLDTEPDGAAAALRRAVELQPYDTDARIALALLAEAQGDPATAESLYIAATQVSRRFRPRYALAAYYAQTGRHEDFWKLAAEAAAIDNADVERIARLALETGEGPDTIPGRLQLRTEHALAAYLPIAAAGNSPRALAEIALRLPATLKHRAALVQACDRLIATGEADAAVAVWNRLGLFEGLSPAEGRSLTNTRFEVSKVSGFNWRPTRRTGVAFRPASAGMRVELSGGQPERVVLLEQLAPVLPDRAYRLTVDSDVSGLSSAAGLEWTAQCVNEVEPVSAQALPATLAFRTPPGCSLLRLALEYRREPGTVRIEGDLELRSARLELQP
jgi:tetratricopeptide (TPR) repeat protein